MHLEFDMPVSASQSVPFNAILVVNVYYVMGFRPNYFTCTAHLYLYYILLVLHTYASYIGTDVYFLIMKIQYKSFSISNMVSEPLL